MQKRLNLESNSFFEEWNFYQSQHFRVVSIVNIPILNMFYY